MEASSAPILQGGRQQASIETLPTEVKVMILRCLPNETSLNNIVNACRIYGSVQENFDEVLTAITINQLRKRGFDPFGPQNVMQVCLHESNEADADFWKAIQSFWNECQHQERGICPKPVTLPAMVCKEVLKIVHVVGWVVGDDIEYMPSGDGFPLLPTSFKHRSTEKSIRPYQYHTGYLSGHPSEFVDMHNCSLIFLGGWDNSSAFFKDAVEVTIRQMSYDREFPALP